MLLFLRIAIIFGLMLLFLNQCYYFLGGQIWGVKIFWKIIIFAIRKIEIFIIYRSIYIKIWKFRGVFSQLWSFFDQYITNFLITHIFLVIFFSKTFIFANKFYLKKVLLFCYYFLQKIIILLLFLEQKLLFLKNRCGNTADSPFHAWI